MSWNVLGAILTTLDGIVISLKQEQFVNEREPIEVTDLGMLMEDNLLQLPKAQSGISLRGALITTF